MRAVIQRVAQASVAGGGSTETIGRGLCILIGIERGDGEGDQEVLLKKILSLNMFPNEDKKWASSIVDVGGEILVVSQFTLHAVYKGKRPSFHRAEDPEVAKEMFYGFVERLREAYVGSRVKNCVFGSYMSLSLVNDGPVTLIVDSKNPRGT